MMNDEMGDYKMIKGDKMMKDKMGNTKMKADKMMKSGH